MRVQTIVLLCLSTLVLCSCSRQSEENWLDKSYREIEEAARGTQVAFFMFGGWAHVNTWIDTYAAAELKKRYDIDLKRVPMDAHLFVNKLLTEKQAEKKKGTMDLLWINGENFKNAREADILFGPFSHILPNWKYIDAEEVRYDFGHPVEGYEAPYGRAQFVFEYDSETIPDPPDTYDGLFDWIKQHPGRFTYPQPPDFTGSAFIRQVFYAVSGGHEQYMDGFHEALLAKNSPLLWKYLNEIKPYLWQEGRSYPRDSEKLDTLFERGEVDLNMSYHQVHAQNLIVNGRYRNTVKTFVMTDGSIYNTHFTAIPFNAPNKAGAIVTANFLLSADAQFSKNDPQSWGDATVLDLQKLPENERRRFQNLDLGDATLPFEVLVKYAVPEIPSAYLETLETGWEENVLHRSGSD